MYIKKKPSAIGWSPVYLLVASRASQGNTSLFVNLAGEIAVSNLMPLGVRKWPIVINAPASEGGGENDRIITTFARSALLTRKSPIISPKKTKRN